VVVDDRGVKRVVIGQDPVTQQRRTRVAGITIHDSTGAERGGFATLDDGSAVIGLDAPVGVGSPMRDRAAMVVGPAGESYVMLIDNKTRGVVRLHSDGNGGGLKLFKWDDHVRTRTLTYDGEHRDSTALKK